MINFPSKLGRTFYIDFSVSKMLKNYSIIVLLIA